MYVKQGPHQVTISECCCHDSSELPLLLLLMSALSVEPFSLCPVGINPGCALDYFHSILAEGETL